MLLVVTYVLLVLLVLVSVHHSVLTVVMEPIQLSMVVLHVTHVQLVHSKHSLVNADVWHVLLVQHLKVLQLHLVHHVATEPIVTSLARPLAHHVLQVQHKPKLVKVHV